MFQFFIEIADFLGAYMIHPQKSVSGVTTINLQLKPNRAKTLDCIRDETIHLSQSKFNATFLPNCFKSCTL